MFTQLEPREVHTEGVLESNAFTIKANGKAFKVLIDGLYSDKVRSIIRELWSNAFDSHIEAGKGDLPFDCQLPTIWEPYFRVRDYGVSLTHEGVMRLYTTVFESSKEGTNTQVGKLGLGSKSPFAYTDTFTVTAWLNGEKRVYSAYIGSDSVPMIALLGTEPSDEPQGLEVAFPVKSSDINTFHTAADRVALGFDILPNTFDVKLDPPVSEARYSGAGWKLCDSDEGMSALAKQGCVVYPIDPNAVVGATEHQRAFLHSPLFIDFAIGELEIAASREGLGYDAATCANILRAVDRISVELMQQLEEQFSHLNTYWEACEFYSQLVTGYGIPKPVLKVLEKMRFRGRELADKWYISDKDVRKIESVVANGKRRRNSGGWDGNTQFYVNPRDSLVYFQDTSKKITCIKERLKYHYQSLGSSRHLIIVRGEPGSMDLKRTWVSLGRPPKFYHVADLPLPPRQKKVRQTLRVKRFCPSSYHNWKETDIDPADGGIYVPLSRNVAQRIIGEQTEDKPNHQVETTIATLKSLGVLPDDVAVYGIPATLRRLQKQSNWRCLWDIAAATMEVAFDAAAIARHNALRKFLSELHYMEIGSMCLHWREGGLVPEHIGPAYVLLRDYSAIAIEADELAHHQHYAKLVPILSEFEIDTPAAGTDLDLSQQIDDVLAAYPMLDLALNVSVNEDRAKTLLDYVNLIDNHVIPSNTVSDSAEEAA